jgi:hypothetical protein
LKRIGASTALLVAFTGLLDGVRIFLLSSQSFTCTVARSLPWCDCQPQDCSQAEDFSRCIEENRRCEAK